MVELVVFDMAGTTVDEDNVVYKTVRDSINSRGYEFTLEQVLEAGAGKEKSQAIRDVLALDGNTHTDEEVAAIFAEFKSRLASAYDTLDVKEQPGASDVFSALRARGIKVVLNTGYDRSTAEKLIDKIGWSIGGNIDGLVTASDVSKGRPGPEMIQLAMKRTGVANAEAVVKIGDSQIDIVEGKNAECGLTFGITTGAQTEAMLRVASPSYVVQSLSEFLALISNSP